uniref:hypothetical protein n=1 Tax=Ornithinimicrobium sp. CNJ-824 TaxID=1904966 RepID=UPI001EDC47A9|nr:hypothetical protein [Ornithinimicrobium sp. CNJ-824]
MNELSTPEPARHTLVQPRDGGHTSTGDGLAHSRWVGSWERSETLDALRSLLDTSRRATPALARRADLSHTEAAVLEHIMDERPAPPSSPNAWASPRPRPAGSSTVWSPGATWPGGPIPATAAARSSSRPTRAARRCSVT